jgi:hypothetical protein
MIVNAKDKKISECSDLPDVSDAVMKYLRPVSIGIVTTSNLGGLPNPVPTWFRTQASCQPFTAEQLEIKPEGQRSWKWSTIHTLTDMKLNNNDQIIFDGVKYKVMAKLDYSRFGYYEYHCIEGYIPDGEGI